MPLPWRHGAACGPFPARRRGRRAGFRHKDHPGRGKAFARRGPADAAVPVAGKADFDNSIPQAEFAGFQTSDGIWKFFASFGAGRGVKAFAARPGHQTGASAAPRALRRQRGLGNGKVSADRSISADGRSRRGFMEIRNAPQHDQMRLLKKAARHWAGDNRDSCGFFPDSTRKEARPAHRTAFGAGSSLAWSCQARFCKRSGSGWCIGCVW